MTSYDLTFDSPEKRRLRKRIEYLKYNYKKKIRDLQQNIRRKTNQVATLKSVLQQLQEQNVLNIEQVDVLQTMGESPNIVQRLAGLKCAPRQYDAQLRSFALTLHYYSPRAYEYVRSKFHDILPHAKTISKWYGTIGGKPGINLEALSYIKQRVNNTDYSLVASLMFDEMAIRQHVEFDGTKFSGYTDMGDNIVCDDTNVASEALVFMIVCINNAWKIPIAYYLINKITAEQKSNLVLQCISAVSSTGLKIVTVTCDGMSTNISTLKLLGCNFDNMTSLQTFFLHPERKEKIFAFLDPCHMLKLVRNTLGDEKTLIDGNGQCVQWSDLVILHNLQENEGMHLGNKLRTSHIDYRNQKMKVRLAAQIFSTSVANALSFCKNNLKLKEFQFCEGTIQFLHTFNDLFDILNSRSIKQSGYKQPLNEQNKELIIKKLEQTKQYILSLKTKNGQLLIKSRKKTGFLGFLICINSILVLYDEVCEKMQLLKYIPCYKISQDHIELLFGSIRHHGGHNSNPTARQFKAAMKKILVHAEIRDEQSGNCIPLEHISILHVSSEKRISKSEVVLNMTTRLSRMIDSTMILTNICENESEDQFHFVFDHNYLTNVTEISEFSNNIIEYIAGYIVKQLQKKLYCEECLRVLTIQSSNTNNFVYAVNRGGLIQPTQDVITICIKCERIIRHNLHISSNTMISKKLDETYLTNNVLQSLFDTNLFESLREHTYDQTPMENHILHLMRAIVQKYIKIRLHHIALNSIDKSKNKRHLFHKLVLFQGM